MPAASLSQPGSSSVLDGGGVLGEVMGRTHSWVRSSSCRSRLRALTVGSSSTPRHLLWAWRWCGHSGGGHGSGPGREVVRGEASWRSLPRQSWSAVWPPGVARERSGQEWRPGAARRPDLPLPEPFRGRSGARRLISGVRCPRGAVFGQR